MDIPRPKWLAYQAKAGIYDVHFEHKQNVCRKDLRDFISRAMRWSDCNDETVSDSSHKKNEYRILDSFFSDSFERSDIASLLDMAKENSAPVKFLLANPNSEFAKSRASGIHYPWLQEDTETETKNGLKLIFQSMMDIFGIEISKKQLDRYSLNELAGSIQTEGRKHNIELRFYDVSTGGPLIFFRDILLVGRYDFGVSSIAMPWNMIVDDVYRENDIYDLHWDVFNKIWEHAKESIVDEYTICFCYTADQKTTVDNIVTRLAPLHLEIAYSEHKSPSRATWDGNKLSDMAKYSEIVFLCSLDAIENPGFCAEFGAAWALGKTIHPLLVGLKSESMSALPVSRGVNFLKADNDGLEQLISGIQERTKS